MQRLTEELDLTKSLGYEWDQVHAEAERLEHHVSNQLEACIASALGHPTRDPHGDPIPSADEHLFGRPLAARINVAPRPRGARGRR